MLTGEQEGEGRGEWLETHKKKQGRGEVKRRYTGINPGTIWDHKRKGTRGKEGVVNNKKRGKERWRGLLKPF